VIRFQNELLVEHMAARDDELARRVPQSQRQIRPTLTQVRSLRQEVLKRFAMRTTGG
jgi:hypothetical protein